MWILIWIMALVIAIYLGLIRAQARPSAYFKAPVLVIAWFLVGVVLGVLGELLPTGAPRTVEMAIVILLTVGLSYRTGRSGLEDREAAVHYRGARLVSALSARDRVGSPSLRLAGEAVAPLDETKHFKLIGTTGTGKSTAIRELLAGALERGDRAVFADPGGGFRDVFYKATRGDVILNPFAKESPKWDLFAEIREPYDHTEIARSLIPDGVGDERVWRTYAQTLLTALLKHAERAGVTDLRELRRLVAAAPMEELRILLESSPAQPFVAESNERMFGSIRSVAASAVAALEYIEAQQSAAFSVRRWVREGRGVLFLPYTAGQIAALRNLISTWMRIAIFETLNLPAGDARLWFVIDELDALGPIEGLKDALTRLRKVGGRCVLGFQSIGQVSATYGAGEADTIVENCANSLILRCSAAEGGGTSRFASRLIGEREIVRASISRTHHPDRWFASRTESQQHVTEAAVLPSEIEQLPDLEGYLKLAAEPAWQRVTIAR
jgi:type IV secretory pathway TraG/TraD family ATPase VirD4